LLYLAAGQGEDMAFEQDQQSKLDRLAMALERARIGEYVELMQQPLRVIYISFLSGLARGFGIIIGFTVIGAVVIYVLQRVVALNLPGLSKAIADLIRLVQQNMVR
jgi:hypothetical protein